MESKKFAELINGSDPVLVDFSAEWCGPCKMMAPVLSELKRSMGERLMIIKVDIDRNTSAARQYNISGVPTLILFRQGQMLWRQSGVMPASQLRQLIEQKLVM
jgi:thioredoxin 1